MLLCALFVLRGAESATKPTPHRPNTKPIHDNHISINKHTPANSIAINHRADGLKLYPTLVIRGTGLYELWAGGHYRSYPADRLVDLAAR